MDIVVIGNAGVDTCIYLPGDRVDETVEANFTTNLDAVGQAGGYASRGYAALGHTTGFIGALGQDPAGDLVRAQFARDGVDLRGVFTDPQGTARSVNLVYPDGRRKNFYDGKGHMTLSPDLEALRPILAGARLAHINIPNWARLILPLLRELGVTIAVDLQDVVSGDDPYRLDFVDAADYIFFSAANHPDPTDVMRTYWARNPRLTQVVGMGANGCALGQLGAIRFFAPPSLDWPVVDTNGAGDALAVGFLAARVFEGLSPDEAIRWGQTAARRTCAQRVPKEGLARRGIWVPDKGRRTIVDWPIALRPLQSPHPGAYMTTFNRTRLTNDVFKLDVERMRQGWYSDKYFENISAMLTHLAAGGYLYAGSAPRLAAPDLDEVEVGNLEVEMQWFTRRPGSTIVVGVDKCLEMIRHCAGYFEDGHFVDTWDQLQVEAVHDGDVVRYSGDPKRVMPVIRVRGRYRDFALLETPTLGILTRASRVATNVYRTFEAARGKPVLFFPARFDLHEVQAADGYAYNVALQRFNRDYGNRLGAFISTDAQGDWWGGAGGGTVAHAAIACFFGDTAETMLAFCAARPASIPRIALVDFNNDCIGDSLATLEAMFTRYRALCDAGQVDEARRYMLFGVRLDTGATLRDISVPPLGDTALDLGVNPRLVFLVRQALDNAWTRWEIPEEWRARAQAYCRDVKIVVSGGFSPEKIQRFEKLGVPVDIYAVGSSLFENHGSTVTDFTADVVRVKVDDVWHAMAKVGRAPCDNPDLEPVR